MAIQFQFYVSHPGEPGAGIRSYSDEILVTVQSGDPGGDPGEFPEWMRQAIAEWCDGAKVTCRNPEGKQV